MRKLLTFFFQSPGGLCCKAGSRTRDPCICSQTRYRLWYGARDKVKCHSGRFKWNSALNLSQNVQIQIILRMPKVSSGPLLCIFLHFVVSNDSISGQWRSWSDCADAQSDLDLHCPYMLEDTFSHGAALLTLEWMDTPGNVIAILRKWDNSFDFDFLITKTRLFKYNERFSIKKKKKKKKKKKWKFSDKKIWYFFLYIFLLKI